MRLRADTLTSLLALGLAGYIIQQGLALELGTPSDPGSGFILFWAGVIMAGLSALLLGQSLLPGGNPAGLGDGFAGTRWAKVLYVVVLLVVYARIVEYYGFILTTFALLLVLFKTVEPQSWRVSLAGAFLTTLCAWAVFVAWLGTQLPVGSVFGD